MLNPAKSITPLLGRWNLKNNQGVGNILANNDHCGSTLCKDPTETKKQISLALFKSDIKGGERL